MQIPDWLGESRVMSALSADERRHVEERQQQANASLAPYIGLACLIFFSAMVIIDIERYREHLFNLSLSGLAYTLVAVCHITLALSIVPALALKSRRAAEDRTLAARWLRWHQVLLMGSLLTVGCVAVLLDGKFMRLGSVLIVVNLLYALAWRYRFAVNATSVLISSVFVLRNGAGEALLPMVAFGEMAAVICLCAIGGAVIHRDRVQFYLAQYRESLYLARLREEISVAAQLQQSMLPAPWPASREFAVHGLMRPAKDIGGDFYDHFIVQNGAVCLVAADVCGKGIPAGLFSMSAKSAMRATTIQSSTATAAPDPGRLVAGVNNLLHEGNEDLLFVTAIYALYQPASGQLDFVNAGHVKPLLLGRDGHARWLDAPKGCALGARADRTYSAARIDLQAGDTVLLITDGITEALNSEFEEFGMDRVMQSLDGATGSDAKSCIERLLSAVDEFTGGVEQSDDITCIAVCHQPIATQPRQTARTD